MTVTDGVAAQIRVRELEPQIEQLRAENQRLTELLQMSYPDQMAEIDRLLAAVDAGEVAMEAMIDVGKKADDEIATLRAILASSRHHVRATLTLNDENRLALAVQGRALIRQIDIVLDGPVPSVPGDKTETST